MSCFLLYIYWVVQILSNLMEKLIINYYAKLNLSTLGMKDTNSKMFYTSQHTPLSINSLRPYTPVFSTEIVPVKIYQDIFAFKFNRIK